ncbi:hypothetical protein M0R72_03350 [Candidatus Pacearchaeota archaeon]|jgi:hypothetical protein|nr:hypothetical protein [Candidatus Pacearchaeota archaeon]
METRIYATRKGNFQNSVYHLVDAIKKIEDSDYSTRIIFQNGEIDISVFDNMITYSSKRYSSSGIQEVNRFTKKLIPSYHPTSAIVNAKKCILQRVINLTVGKNAEMIEFNLDKLFPRPEQLDTFGTKKNNLEKDVGYGAININTVNFR